MESVQQQGWCREARGVEGSEVSISGPMERRRFILGGATTLFGLWGFALGHHGHEATNDDSDKAAWAEAFVVSATPETAVFARERGQQFHREEGDVRFKVLIRDEAGCVECLLREMTLAILLPEPLHPNVLEKLAQRRIPLTSFLISPDGQGHATGDTAATPPAGSRTFYLYAPEVLVRKRPRLRTFTRFCQGRKRQEIPIRPS